jgi:nucleotide-binding universal stress UspA family protein
MYTNILIPTDGSELAAKAVQHDIALESDYRCRGVEGLWPYRHGLARPPRH